MRILLDESLPIDLRSEIHGHDIRYVRELGWSGLKNGALIAQAASLFDVILTADQNLHYQQNLSTLPIAVIILVARSNRIEQLRPCFRGCCKCLRRCSPAHWYELRRNDAVNRTRRHVAFLLATQIGAFRRRIV